MRDAKQISKPLPVVCIRANFDRSIVCSLDLSARYFLSLYPTSLMFFPARLVLLKNILTGLSSHQGKLNFLRTSALRTEVLKLTSTLCFCYQRHLSRLCPPCSHFVAMTSEVERICALKLRSKFSTHQDYTSSLLEVRA